MMHYLYLLWPVVLMVSIVVLINILLRRSKPKKTAAAITEDPKIPAPHTSIPLGCLDDDLADELVAAQFRQTVQKPPTPHPIAEPFRKAMVLFAREWGMSVHSEHHFYDFVDYDKHVVNVRFECMTKKAKIL